MNNPGVIKEEEFFFKRLLKEKGLSAAKVTRLMKDYDKNNGTVSNNSGIDYSYFNRFLNGCAKLPVRCKESFCHVLDITEDYFNEMVRVHF